MGKFQKKETLTNEKLNMIIVTNSSLTRMQGLCYSHVVTTSAYRCTDQSVRHTHIYAEPNANDFLYFLVVEKKFNSVDELITFYKTNPVKNLENVSDVFLRHPIVRENAHNGFDSLDRRPTRSTSLSSMNSNGTLGSGSTASLNRPPAYDPVPPVPIRPSPSRTMSSGSSGTLDLSSLGSILPNVDISSRPALPLPPQVKDEETYVYSNARNVDEDISERLKNVLKSNERCECGIPRNLAELPLGWTVHLSKDALTAGRLFYQNEQGLTSWTLPNEVKQQLTKVHIANLRKIDRNWKFPH